jgi:hypothetical protein
MTSPNPYANADSRRSCTQWPYEASRLSALQSERDCNDQHAYPRADYRIRCLVCCLKTFSEDAVSTLRCEESES